MNDAKRYWDGDSDSDSGSDPHSDLGSDYLSSLLALAEEVGLDAVGVASAEPFDDAREELEARRSRGLASSMQFTYRNPARSCDPSAALTGAKSLIVGALRYEGDGGTVSGSCGKTGRRVAREAASGTSRVEGSTAASTPWLETASGACEGSAREAAEEARGEMMLAKVAAYAQRDYYADLRSALEEIAKRLRDDGHEALVVADDNALMDREAARRAGLGWYGKNTCLLIPRKGSRFVLGSVITTAEFAPSKPIDRTCGTCSLCQQACPTGALDTAGQLDARRCLAWLLQAEGIFPREYRAALGNRFYGCDDCQDVCPINSLEERLGENRRATAHLFLNSDRELARKRHAVPRLPRATQETSCGTVQENLDCAPVLDVLKLTDEELMDRYGSFYIARRQPRYLRRNALLVLANAAPLEASLHFGTSDRGGGEDGGANGFEEVNAVSGQVNAALKEAVEHEDPMLRAHGVWAAQRLGRFDLAESANCDPDARVREEARRPVPLAEMPA